MKVETKVTKKNIYPYIGINEIGLLVLFTNENTGVALDPRLGQTGFFSEHWTESKYQKFNGEVILKND